MKYLQDYREAKQTALFNETGTFFAFSQDQFNEQKVEGIKYTSCGGGMLCPSDNVKALIKGLEDIQKSAVAQDIAENGINAIIERELYNHECFYTGDISSCEDALKVYPTITHEMIANAYRKELPNANL